MGDLKWYNRKYLLNIKEGSNGEIQEQKENETCRQLLVNINITLWVILLNVNELNTWNGKILILTGLWKFRQKLKQEQKQTTKTIQKYIVLKPHRY